ncbi:MULTISPECIES: TetR/AcrR family transcriptional regulator [Streptomyces]|jgi:AcrR family transcriptional regulator|uniref:TetR/AcrR family transcriptional regulator n=1 Tax=Streptomyces TaxID=1883 RepID=UPI001903FB4D|nr:TetR/AcrR family transcriptional regulator [Streptomyces sp. XC 2026]QQN77201.1 TetR/AcrR family transcriptional regulator [Streptomyces sp. XC 2026]
MAGLRERKKQQTRQHISDVATGMFLERGFDEVTVAEVAEAADVSVNTVYNYFPAKEDLFLDRQEEVIDHPSLLVRERAPGQSAAEAVLGAIRQDIISRGARIGMAEGMGRFIQVMFGTESLRRRMMEIHQRTGEHLTETLREAAGADERDHLPELIAGQLLAIRTMIFRTVGHRMIEGRPLDEIADLALEKLDAAQSLLSQRLLDYARRPAAPDTPPGGPGGPS